MVASSLSIDFGVLVPGVSGIVLTCTSLATGYLLRKKVTVISSSVPGSVIIAPQFFVSGTELEIKNRSANIVVLSPGSLNQFENYGIGIPVGVAAGANAQIISFDPPAMPSPRTWWIISGASLIATNDIELEDFTGHWLFEDGTAIRWGGTATTTSDIELEDFSGRWLFSDGTAIQWGSGAVTTSDVELEDLSGRWLFGDGTTIQWGGTVSPTGLEDGSGDWLFGDGTTLCWG